MSIMEGSRYRRTRTRVWASCAVVVAIAGAAVVVVSTQSNAAAAHTITFVNHSGETVWIGSLANSDGSRTIVGLPTLADGQSATVRIPDDASPPFWRGTFFARQRCGGQPGQSFHCLVGDCGVYADRCANGQQPVSLAEFNFDRNDSAAPWYDVSYVDAVSLPLTIEPRGADAGRAAGTCVRADCSGNQLLSACPAENARYDQQTGDRILCVNPNRDGQTAYTQALAAFSPRAYTWSTEDRAPGHTTVLNCGQCPDFVVTLHGGQPAGRAPAPANRDDVAPGAHAFRGDAGKCIDVPGGMSNDGAQLQLWDCNGTPAQSFTAGANGSQVALGKCMDVAWASRDNGAKVQLARCNGGPAQIWVIDGTRLRNPNSGKCVDVRDRSPNNGAPLQIWDCDTSAHQAWHLI
jgi:Ricin-type beta-trefoil lectin domain/Thaumatin family